MLRAIVARVNRTAAGVGAPEGERPTGAVAHPSKAIVSAAVGRLAFILLSPVGTV
jgi:hypothetical protein